jgi:hypothetical protein
MFTCVVHTKNRAKPWELPLAANTDGRKSIFWNVLQIGYMLTQMMVGGVGISKREWGIIPELLFDVPEGHLEWKDTGINVEEAFLPDFETGRDVVYMLRKTVPF